MKRTIIMIDGGHLRALAKQDRQNYTPTFIEVFAKSLSVPDEEDIMRILYYDCAPYVGQQAKPVSGEMHQFNKSGAWLDDLAKRDLFAVRRGVLKWRGWKPKGVLARDANVGDRDFKPDFEQKGVDLRIGLDIATYSLERTIHRVILITGDTDLIPAMKLARRSGVQLVGIELPGGRLSSELLAHIDFLRTKPWPVI